jgi:hypothetical protein
MRTKFFIVIGYNDGKYAVIDRPEQALGYRAQSVCCFGKAKSDKELELLKSAWQHASFGPCQFHHFP